MSGGPSAFHDGGRRVRRGWRGRAGGFHRGGKRPFGERRVLRDGTCRRRAFLMLNGDVRRRFGMRNRGLRRAGCRFRAALRTLLKRRACRRRNLRRRLRDRGRDDGPPIGGSGRGRVGLPRGDRGLILREEIRKGAGLFLGAAARHFAVADRLRIGAGPIGVGCRRRAGLLGRRRLWRRGGGGDRRHHEAILPLNDILRLAWRMAAMSYDSFTAMAHSRR